MKVGLVILFFLFVTVTGMGQEGVRPQLSISALEERIHESINAERVRNRLPGLELDQDLSRIARAHSLDMATMDSRGHRTNILNRSHDRSGIGIALTPDDKVLITQLFC